MPWFIPLLIGLALNVVAYLILPKPMVQQTDTTKDLENPTAESGRPLPVVFGSIRVQGLNIMWFGDKETIKRNIGYKTSGKK